MFAGPRYNAGRGAALNELGDMELDASIVDGRTLRAGAVTALRFLFESKVTGGNTWAPSRGIARVTSR